MTPITVLPNIVRDHGPAAALTLAVISAHDEGDGVTLFRKQIAEESGLTESTVKRALAVLSEAGLIEVESQFQGGSRGANRYQIQGSLPGAIPTDPRVKSVQPIYTNTTNTSSLNNTSILSKASPSAEAQKDPQEEFLWPERNSPMPDPRNILGRRDQSLWLVIHLEDLLLERNSELLASGRKPSASVTEKRRQGWLTNASWILERPDSPRLQEVSDVLTWIFTDCDGHMPFPVRGPKDYYGRTKDAKVTNLRVVADNWPRLLMHYKARTGITGLEGNLSPSHTAPQGITPTTPSSSLSVPPGGQDDGPDETDWFRREIEAGFMNA